MINQNQTKAEIVRDVMTLLKMLEPNQRLIVTVMPVAGSEAYFDFQYDVDQSVLRQPVCGPSEVAAAMHRAYHDSRAVMGLST